MAVDIKAGTKLEAGIPHQLFIAMFRGAQARNPVRHVMSVTPDGQRFLLRVPPGSSGSGTGGSTGVPEVPLVVNIQSFGSGAALSSLGNLGTINNGLTVIQHWTTAMGRAEK
jgi:hypothetical protein